MQSVKLEKIYDMNIVGIGGSTIDRSEWMIFVLSNLVHDDFSRILVT